MEWNAAAHFYTSPYFVVPVLALVFLACILYGTIGDRHRFDETLPDESEPQHDSH